MVDNSKEKPIASEQGHTPLPFSNKESPPVLQGLTGRMKKIGHKVTTTILDREVYSKLFAIVTEKYFVEFKQSAPSPMEPVKSVEKYRKTSPCSYKWDQMAGTGAVRFCEKCKQQVYDFESMDQAEAEDRVLQREGKSKVILYKRTDGKFLTNDCPVGLKKRQYRIMFIAASVLLIGCILAMVRMMPPPPAAPPTPAAKLNQPAVVHGEKSYTIKVPGGMIYLPHNQAPMAGKQSDAHKSKPASPENIAPPHFEPTSNPSTNFQMIPQRTKKASPSVSMMIETSSGKNLVYVPS